VSVTVTYESNNSGGSWWLRDEDWHKLAAAGWAVDWEKDKTGPLRKGERFLGALAMRASKDFADPREAIAEFERITGQDASDEGCNCCGPPHSFSYKDADGGYHYASARVTATAIDFDA
jgi:hypothetical protein